MPTNKEKILTNLLRHTNIQKIFLLLLFVFFAHFRTAWSDTNNLSLQIPLDCQVGTSCFIQNYVDADPTSGYKDYNCGFLSYDGHKGTDFRLPDLTMMHNGVNVLAAAPGKVRALRDSMPDISIRDIDSSLVEGKEAGNSVAIQHGNGWETQYSHLRRGSLLVKVGERVEAGQPLGLVGISGNTEFPHLHFSVRLHGKIIDPFTGLGGGGCNNIVSPLWNRAAGEKLEYIATGILKLAFADQRPARKPYYEYLNEKKVLSENADRIIFWSHVFGVRKGDKFSMQIISPIGEILDQERGNHKCKSGTKIKYDR